MENPREIQKCLIQFTVPATQFVQQDEIKTRGGYDNFAVIRNNLKDCQFESSLGFIVRS